MKEIPLTQGLVALIDDEDHDLVSQYRWHAARPSSRLSYARRTWPPKQFQLMHRLITAAKPGQEVDHIDGNGLNNQRSNLRIVSHAENGRNRGLPSHNKSGYRGVSRKKDSDKWLAQITVNQCTHYLGTFTSPVDAAVAYDAAARKHFGEFARINFPERNSK